MIRTVYHSQEHRTNELDEPIICVDENAWLGVGWYFWISEDDALFWGNRKKRKTGEYDIYKCEVDCEDVLDTVFNEEHYRHWIRTVEKIAKNIIKRTGFKPTLKDINEYVKEHGIWDELDGIMFQDISENPIHFMVKQFQYKKRIQIALYNRAKINNFALLYTGDCN